MLICIVMYFNLVFTDPPSPDSLGKLRTHRKEVRSCPQEPCFVFGPRSSTDTMWEPAVPSSLEPAPVWCVSGCVSAWDHYPCPLLVATCWHIHLSTCPVPSSCYGMVSARS